MNRSSSWIAVLPSLLIPICLGMMMYLGLSAVLERGVIEDETVVRYLTGHPVSKGTLILFFVGVGSLAMIAANVFGQFAAARSIRLSALAEQDASTIKSDVDTSVDLASQLVELPSKYREHYLWQRLHDALQFVHRTGSSAGLEDETKYLSELDQDRQHQRYSLVRILIWATPMLGFLGTVLGISQALGGIDIGPDNDFQQMMAGLRSSLYVAFDTTALALTLSIVLMFGQFLIDRFESQLLRLVDHRTRSELSAHFAMSNNEADAAIDTLAANVLATAEIAAERQTLVWLKTIEAAEVAWGDSITGVSEQVQESLTSALENAVGNLGSSLDYSIRRADQSMAHRWQQWQIMLSENSRNLKDQQRDLLAQTQLIKQVVENFEQEKSAPAGLDESDDSFAETPERLEPSPSENTFLFEPAQNLVEEDVESSPAAETTPANSDATEPIPEIVLVTNDDILQLHVTDSNHLADAEPDSDVDQLPRYQAAEKEAGVSSIVSFPIQIVDHAKKAA